MRLGTRVIMLLLVVLTTGVAAGELPSMYGEDGDTMTIVYGHGSIFSTVSQALDYAEMMGFDNPDVISMDMWRRRMRRANG